MPLSCSDEFQGRLNQSGSAGGILPFVHCRYDVSWNVTPMLVRVGAI